MIKAATLSEKVLNISTTIKCQKYDFLCLKLFYQKKEVKEFQEKLECEQKW